MFFGANFQFIALPFVIPQLLNIEKKRAVTNFVKLQKQFLGDNNHSGHLLIKFNYKWFWEFLSILLFWEFIFIPIGIEKGQSVSRLPFLLLFSFHRVLPNK